MKVEKVQRIVTATQTREVEREPGVIETMERHVEYSAEGTYFGPWEVVQRWENHMESTVTFELDGTKHAISAGAPL